MAHFKRKQYKNSDSFKRFRGKLRDHFAIKIGSDGNVENGDKINRLHCNQQFAYFVVETQRCVSTS